MGVTAAIIAGMCNARSGSGPIKYFYKDFKDRMESRLLAFLRDMKAKNKTAATVPRQEYKSYWESLLNPHLEYVEAAVALAERETSSPPKSPSKSYKTRSNSKS